MLKHTLDSERSVWALIFDLTLTVQDREDSSRCKSSRVELALCSA